METFNRNELGAARRIFKWLLKRNRFFGEEAVVRLTIRTIDALLVKNFRGAGLKFSSLPEDEQRYANDIAHDYGYVDRNGRRTSRFDGDDYFLVTLTKGIMDDFDFNRSAITKLAMGLMIKELPQFYVPASESYKLTHEFHGVDCFPGIDCCNNTPWNSEYRKSCYKLAMKVLAESQKEEQAMKDALNTIVEHRARALKFTSDANIKIWDAAQRIAKDLDYLDYLKTMFILTAPLDEYQPELAAKYLDALKQNLDSRNIMDLADAVTRMREIVNEFIAGNSANIDELRTLAEEYPAAAKLLDTTNEFFRGAINSTIPVADNVAQDATPAEPTLEPNAIQQSPATPLSEPSNEQLTAEIKVYLGQIGQGIIEVGTRLNIMKRRLQHGEWLPWLKDNFNLSQQTASNFMRCAERFGNYQSISNLGSTQMIAMLALPADETEQFIEAKAAEGTPVEDMTIKKLREEIQQWKAKAEDADKQISQLQADASKSRDTQNKLQTELDALHFDFDNAKSVAAAARKERDTALAAAREAEEKLKNQQPQVVIQAPEDYDATKQALKDAQAQNQQLQQQLADRPVEVQVPADYHDNKKALTDAQEELASNRKALSDAHEQISNMMLEKQTQDAERLSAEEYAVAAKDLDTISALLLDLVYKKTQSLNKVIKDYRQNNPQRLEQIIELFENFVRDYKR